MADFYLLPQGTVYVIISIVYMCIMKFICVCHQYLKYLFFFALQLYTHAWPTSSSVRQAAASQQAGSVMERMTVGTTATRNSAVSIVTIIPQIGNSTFLNFC